MANIDEQLRWFENFRSTPQFERFKRRPIAYFCAEYALAENIPIYSGGLGILAGDVVREASDRQIPFVAIGLYYQEGYLCDKKDTGGEVIEVCKNTPPDSVGFAPVMNAQGERLIIQVPIQDRDVSAQAWQRQINGITMYLLDTNVSANTPADSIITNRLYVADKETRFKQELVLGIGGLRLLEALSIHPSIYHLNEGHSAILTLEMIRHEMQERKLGFDEAKQFVRRRVVFTNHTLVVAGNEVYDNDLVSLMLSKYAEGFGVPVDKLVELGLVHESSTFSMTMLSLRMAGIINAVSKLHAKKAKKVWSDHPMVAVTNGVHIPTWDRVQADVSGKGAFWKIHQQRKAELLKYIQEKTGQEWGENDLLLGWARRIVQYKRPLAVLEDLKRLEQIARNAKQPVRIVFAGNPHPSDKDGLQIVNELKALTQGELADIVVFLPKYDMEVAKLLVAGCDVWLNTPVVGFEASGTSGMKAALNGALSCTTKDGWVDEAEMNEAGWILNSDQVSTDFYNVLERDIVPMYYDRNSEGVPEIWEKYMVNARSMVLNQFTATRMLREYLELLYS